MAQNVASGTLGTRGIDLQYLALLVNNLYQQNDIKLTGCRLIAIKTLPRCPKVPVIRGEFNDLNPKQPTVVYTLNIDGEGDEPEKQPTVETFFPNHPRMKRKEKEDIYWKIRLMHGASTNPVMFMVLVRELKQHGYTHLVGWHQTETIDQILITFDQIKLRAVHFIPEKYHLTQKFSIFDEDDVPSDLTLVEPIVHGRAVHNILVIQEKFVMDVNGMQFGLRGSKGEIIGHLETIAEYFTRFPGHVTYVQGSESLTPDKEEADLQNQFKLNEFCIAPTIAEVHVHLKSHSNHQKKKIFWCTYCGTVSDILLKCTSCNATVYCNKACQKGDWKWHQIVCCAEPFFEDED